MIVHTCIYDAWAAYDERALVTQLGGSLRQALSERNLINKNEAISFAAYRATVDLFPANDASVFRPLMKQLGYDPEDRSTDISTPSGVGNAACGAVLQFRHHDGSNQLGDLSGDGVPYADYTGYQSVNPPSPVPSDPAIVAWGAKRAFDSVRPATSIPYLFQGQQTRAWGGPGKGTINTDGRFWIPYQLNTFPTPSFPEYVSGHSAFSAAGTQILLLFTGSDQFGASVTLPAGSSKIESGITPANPVTLQEQTFTDAANQAGISRRYGGIYFKAGDCAGRAAGRIVGYQAWIKAWCLWNGQTPFLKREFGRPWLRKLHP